MWTVALGASTRDVARERGTVTDPIGARRSALVYEPAETYEQCLNHARAEGSETGAWAGASAGCLTGGYAGMSLGTSLGGPAGGAIGGLGGCVAGAITGYLSGATAGASIAETRAKVSCDTPEHAGSPSANSGASSAGTTRSAPPAPSSSGVVPTSMPAPAPPAGGASCADGRVVDDASQCGPHAALTSSDFHSVVWG